MTGLVTDIRHAWRRIAARPFPSTLAIGMLALAIGVTTAMFTVVDALLLRPVPFPNVDRLAHVVLRTDNTIVTGGPAPILRAWRDSGIFERVEGGHVATSVVELADAITERDGAFVTPGLLRMLGARPLMGRLFADGEGRDGTDDAAILSERLWRTLGADASLVGQRIQIDGAPFTVVGVLPDTFRFPAWSTELWRPVDYAEPPAALAGANPSTWVLFRPGSSRTDVLRRALAIASDAAPELVNQPGMNASLRADVWPIAGLDARAYLARAMPFLIGGVVLVFLTLCANVTSLLLAQASGRTAEFGMCAALGASRRRLMRQSVTESLVIGGLGIAAGVGTAWALVALTRRWLPDAFLLQTLNPVDLDPRALAVASAVGLTGTLIVAMLPAWLGTRVGASASSRAGREPRGGTESRLVRAFTRGLLVSEIALGTALLAGTALLVASFVRLAAVDRGLDTLGVITARAQLVDGTPIGALADRLRTLPGVTDATISLRGFTHFGDGFVPEATGTPVEIWTEGRSVTSDYFDFYRIPIVRGRAFETTDDGSGVVVSERFSAAMWPDTDPIGQSFQFYDDRFRVVGVAGELRYPSLDRRQDFAELYRPAPRTAGGPTIHIRCRPDCGNPAVLRQGILATGLIRDVRSMEILDQQFDAELARPRAAATLAVAFAAVAVTAAAGGLFSVLSFAVGRRRREFGIRASLGARPIELQRLVFREGVLLAATGFALGGLAAWGLSKGLASVIYEVSATEPTIWFGVAGIIGATTVLACWLPAHRAASADPSTLLREQ